MSTTIDQYHNYVFHTPWGELFYQLLWQQLKQTMPEQQRVLDFGSGFGRTAAHLGAMQQVVAYEPSADMLAQSVSPTNFTQLTDDWATQLAGRQFDWILLHNVLEYVADPARLMTKLTALLAPNGHFSIVKHNRLGHVYASAVFFDDPQRALSEYRGDKMSSQSFGSMHVYETKELSQWLMLQQVISNIWGLRTVLGLSTSQTIKETQSWQQGMLALEQALSQDTAAKQTAFFQHIITKSR